MELFEILLAIFLFFSICAYLFYALLLKKRNLFSFDILFSIVMILSFFPAVSNLGRPYNSVILMMYTVFSLSFLAGYNLKSRHTRSPAGNITSNVYNTALIHKFVFIFLVLGIILWLFFVQQLGGINVLFSGSKMQRSLLTRELDIGYLTLYAPVIFTAFTISILLMAYTKRIKHYLFFTIFSALLVFSMFAKISRGQFVSFVTIPLVIFTIYSRKKSLWVPGLVFLLVLLISVGYKDFSVGVHKLITDRQFTFDFLKYSEGIGFYGLTHPFSEQYYVLRDMLANPDIMPLSEKFGLGYLKSIFVRTIPFVNVPNPGTIYVMRFYPEVYALGGGRGFSSVAEAFLNFHFFGVSILGVVLGVVMRKLYYKAFFDMNPLYVAVYATVLPLAFTFLRIDSTALINALLLYRVIPLLVIFNLARVKKKDISIDNESTGTAAISSNEYENITVDSAD